jgi:putative FmdB family regulatory protein
MPTYEYRCDGCSHEFSVVMSIATHDHGGITCPECRGASITQRFSSFFAKTSRKS